MHEDDIAELADKLALESDKDYALIKISCSSCLPTRPPYLWHHIISVGGLSEDCDFCGILRTCQQHFANDGNYIRIPFWRSRNYIQICLTDAHPKGPYECESIHIQLYSRGSSSTSVQRSV
jgi:hypothetical protein